MGAGSRIDHQHHQVGVGGAAGEAGAAGEPTDERLLHHEPDSTAVQSLVMDPDTGELTVFYHRYDGGGGRSQGYPLANVTAEQWQQLTSGTVSVGRMVQQMANDPAHRPPAAPASDAAQRLIDALRSAPPATDTALPVQRRGAAAAAGELVAEEADAAATRLGTEAPEPDEPSYLQDPAAFQRAYREAQQRQQRGEPAIAYQYDDVTGGLGARDGGRAFGVELEFDLDVPVGMDRGAALRSIVRELHEAGITSSADIHGYHAGRGRDGSGYTDAANGWRMELDGSVNGGELVSPIMYDEPQTWRNLERACEIIRRHGGRATVHAGSHVTVSTADYGHSVEHYNRLLNTFSAHEDTLYRLATDPQRGQHRISQGSMYCAPNTVPATGYHAIDTVRHAQGGHYYGLNLQHATGRSNGRAEFRLWDATLDPAVIQTQIMISLGMADAAARGRGPEPGRRDPLGSHQANNPSGARQTGERWQAATESFRSLVDTIFHRSADRARATALFAATRRWQRQRR